MVPRTKLSAWRDYMKLCKIKAIFPAQIFMCLTAFFENLLFKARRTSSVRLMSFLIDFVRSSESTERSDRMNKDDLLKRWSSSFTTKV